MLLVFERSNHWAKQKASLSPPLKTLPPLKLAFLSWWKWLSWEYLFSMLYLAIRSWAWPEDRHHMTSLFLPYLEVSFCLEFHVMDPRFPMWSLVALSAPATRFDSGTFWHFDYLKFYFWQDGVEAHVFIMARVGVRVRMRGDPWRNLSGACFARVFNVTYMYNM